MDLFAGIRYNQTMSHENPVADVSQETPYQEKKQKWQEALQGVDLLADRLGLGVDEGIKETVAAFHVFDIHTTASHEGKIDRYPIPYIDVESPEIVGLERKLEKFEGGESGSEHEEDAVREEILRRSLEERKKVIPLLEEFYSDRKIPYEVRLNIDSRARGWSRIQSQGADFQEIEKDSEAKKQRLHDFQEEMRDFTEFLKNKYFREE